MKFFNTAGPVNPEDHYCLPPLSRINLEEVLELIEQKKYFILHAPRQSGKTSCMLALVNYLNKTGNYRAHYTNVEASQAMREDIASAVQIMIVDMGERARDGLGDNWVLNHMQEALAQSLGGGALRSLLAGWAAQDAKPLVLMIDEIDSLVGDTLISVLRQIRSGYDRRPAHFPQSVILCGIRDVRDYRIYSSSEKAIITGGSAFNIKAKSLRLGNFNRAEMEQLYLQHTQETGQVFEPEALVKAWECSYGQPWLVNALAYEACFEMKEGKDRSQPITGDLMERAKESLILRRDTHLDQLTDKLQEDRVRRVIEPILSGEGDPSLIPTDDIDYVQDLGLIRQNGDLVIANEIYREIVPRELTYSTQRTIVQRRAWYTAPDGRLQTDKLMTAFQEFFREHSEHWIERFDYKEAGAQLLMQAFLQSVVNGGGQIHREYGLGRGRTDLLIDWPIKVAAAGDGFARFPLQKVVLELKVIGGPRWKSTLDTAIAKGLEQTSAYLDRCGAAEGHLIIFDRSLTKSWDEKIWRREESFGGRPITVWGM